LDWRLVAEDPKDFRALADLEVDLNAEAEGFEDAADPALAADPGDRRRNLAAAEKLLTQVAAIMEKATRLDPTNEAWKAIQADAQVRLATIQTVLHNSGGSGALAKTGIAALRDLARKDQAPPLVLDGAARDFLKVEPASLRDPQFAVSCAEREVALSHRQSPSALLTLAQAYRASGQIEKSRATAKEGLALLPAPQPGGVKPNIRKLLEIQAQTVG
jgi:tetratricopeptide (TPR) repeat protein